MNEIDAMRGDVMADWNSTIAVRLRERAEAAEAECVRLRTHLGDACNAIHDLLAGEDAVNDVPEKLNATYAAAVLALARRNARAFLEQERAT